MVVVVVGVRVRVEVEEKRGRHLVRGNAIVDSDVPEMWTHEPEVAFW